MSSIFMQMFRNQGKKNLYRLMGIFFHRKIIALGIVFFVIH
jgi:hypothetical protein